MIERTGRRGSRHKQLPEDFKGEKKVLEFKEEAPSRTGWGNGFGCRSLPVARQMV